MKKFTAIVMVFLLLVLASPSFAAVGVKVDNTLKGTATDLTFYGGSSLRSPITGAGSFNLVVAGTGTSSATSLTTDQVAISPGYTYLRKAIAASTSSPSYSTGSLGDGTPGEHLTILITYVDSGTGSFVLTPTTKTGFSSLTFDTAGDVATLMYVNDSIGWVVVSHTGCTITLPSDGT